MLRSIALLMFLLQVAIAHADPIPVPGKVTIVDLESDCVPCYLQDSIVHRVEKEFAQKVSFVYLDVEKETWAKEKYAVKILPTLIFFDQQGQEVFRSIGYTKEKAIKDRLNELLNR